MSGARTEKSRRLRTLPPKGLAFSLDLRAVVARFTSLKARRVKNNARGTTKVYAPWRSTAREPKRQGLYFTWANSLANLRMQLDSTSFK